LKQLKAQIIVNNSVFYTIAKLGKNQSVTEVTIDVKRIKKQWEKMMSTMEKKGTEEHVFIFIHGRKKNILL
jgi:hypothetical protein